MQLLKLALTCFVFATIARAADKPNIVFILADDLGYGDLACYGHPYAKTPNIDRLAKQGTLFKQFYVTGAVCCPSRTGFMTGLFPARFGKYPADFGFGGKPTITELLKSAGYRIGHFGKWHIGPESAGRYAIDERKELGGNVDNPNGRDSKIADAAIKFIRQNRKGPFYVNVWCRATHYKVDPAQKFVDEFKELTVNPKDFANEEMREYLGKYAQYGGDVNDGMRRYLGDVYGLDLQVGRILKALDESGLAKDTIVVFSSDNGPALFRAQSKFKGKKDGLDANMLGSSGHLRMRKHSRYDGGVHTPFVIRWPERIAANRMDETSVINGADWLPSICSIVGIGIDESQFDGEDVSDMWLKGPRPRRKPMMWKASAVNSGLAIRDGDWKLHWQGPRVELYRLSDDPGELREVSKEYPRETREVLARLRKWNDELPKAYEKYSK